MSYRIGERVKRDRRSIKKYIVGVMALAFPISVALSGGAAMAHDGNQDNSNQCSGNLVINVTQKVRNDADSGTAGNAWANDNYNRSIKVWQTSTGTATDETYSFCAVTKYDGQFTTYAGPSPQNTGVVGAGVTGDFAGGYTATFTGALDSSPAYPTHGNIGTFNYNCDTSFNCPGYVDWTEAYFTGGVTNFVENPWSWQYDTCNNGSWVNASTGNSGDITGNLSHKDKCHEDNDHHDNDGHHDNDKHHHDEDSHHDGHHEHGDRGPEE